MTGSWRDRTLLDLLTEHGLEHASEREFPTDGWSGATFVSLVDMYGRRYVLKRTSLAIDWIARATRDHDLREGWLAAVPQGALAWIRGRPCPTSAPRPTAMASRSSCRTCRPSSSPGNGQDTIRTSTERHSIGCSARSPACMPCRGAGSSSRPVNGTARRHRRGARSLNG